MHPRSRSVNILRVPIAIIDRAGLLTWFSTAVRIHQSSPGSVVTAAYANAHICNLARRHKDLLRALADADMIYLDGNGPRLISWLLGQPLPPRLTSPDWCDDLFACLGAGVVRLFLLGGTPGTAEEAARRLLDRHPGLRIVGQEHGFFDSDDEAKLISRINALRPDILLLGLGSPKQELWMNAHRDQLLVGIIWCTGGLFDYLSGRVPRAPRWIRRLGMEWFGRLVREPRRLWKRYLLGGPVFLIRGVAFALKERLRAVRQPRSDQVR